MKFIQFKIQEDLDGYIASDSVTEIRDESENNCKVFYGDKKEQNLKISALKLIKAIFADDEKSVINTDPIHNTNNMIQTLVEAGKKAKS